MVAMAELLGMSLWFTASAVASDLSKLWQLAPSETGWLTTSVQLGFVVGTALAALLNLADVVSVRTYFAVSALLGAAANAALLAAPGFGAALVLRFLTGAFLAGVYPPSMKMIATWFRSARGLAVGTLIGSLTLGKAIPYLVLSLAGDFSDVIAVTSGGAGLAALVVAVAYREGPYPFERRPFSWRLAGEAIWHRQTRLAIGGYLGHMWELYAMWTWVPAFAVASLAQRQASTGVGSAPWIGQAIAFGTLAVGFAGSLWGGWAADRIGRERLVTLAMAASGTCALGVGLVYGAHPAWVAAVAWVWGFFVIADSAQFSTLVTEVAPPYAVGTALTLQNSLGFLLTMSTIQLVPVLVEHVGWPWAFPILALGPALGIASIRRLRRVRYR